MSLNEVPHFVGVKCINFSPLMKQDLLIFDQLAIQDLEESLAHIPDKSKVADIEWLHNKGLIFDLNYKKVMHEMFPKHDLMYQLMALSGLLVVLAAMIESPELSNYMRKNVELFSKIGVPGYFDYSLRVLSSYVEISNKVRAVPLLMDIPERETWDILGNVEKVSDVLHSFFKDNNIDHSIKGMLEIALDFAEKIKQRTLDYNEVDNLKDSDVVQVVLQNIPIPDEDVSWEQILDFRNDENSKIYVIKLRRWIKKLSCANLSVKEIQEEIDYLLASYQDHMRFHKMKTQHGIIETIVSVPLDIAEQLIKLKWSNIAKSLFSLQKKKLALMEAERSAPGREIAYIIKAKEEFNG